MASPQRRNAQTILSVGRRMGASPKVLKAAIAAGLVESGLRNLPYGDRDSVGVFQQRPSQGWTGLRNVERAAEEFFQHAIPLRGKYGTAGALAQAVQRSALPEKYGQRGAEADALIRSLGGGPSDGGSSPASGQTVSATVTPGANSAPAFDPGSGVDNSALLGALLSQPRQPSPISVPSPSFAGNRYLKAGQAPVFSVPQRQDSNLGSLLELVQAQGVDLPASQVSEAPIVNVKVTGRQGGSKPAQTSGPGLQLPTSFKSTHETAGLAGYPAVDVFGKPGTAVRAPTSGTVVKVSGHSPAKGAYQGQGGPFGLSAYIKGADGTYFLTHLGSRSVRVGQKIKRGQVIGTIGDYPGGTPDHVHEGLRRGR